MNFGSEMDVTACFKLNTIFTA